MELVLTRQQTFESTDNFHPTDVDHETEVEIFQDLLSQQNNTNFDSVDYANFPRPSTNYSLLAAAAVCNLLGAVSILLNAFVIVALLRNRKRVLTNVFYVLVLHCAFVDVIRGTCLVVWSLPHLMINNLRTIQERLFLFKINQFILIFLRSCNLLTIFMLLIFTMNEYVVIRFPLHYRRYLRKKTILIILACSWLVSLFFGIGSIFSNFFESAHSIMIINNGTLHFRVNATSDIAERLTRRPIAGVSISIVCMLTIFFLCYLCLAFVIISYAHILRTIRKFHLSDTNGRFGSDDIQKFHRNTMRSVEIDKEGRSAVIAANSQEVADVQQTCNSHKKWRSHLMSRHKYLIVIGSVLFVDVLFLLPYSGIQLVALLHLNNFLTTSPKSALIRWGLQIMIGVHSVFQALCYFRMTEFRRLACCWQPKVSRSKSFSQLDKSARSEGQSRDVAATNDEDPNTPNGPRRASGGGVTDLMMKRPTHPVRRLSRLLSHGLLDLSDFDVQEPQVGLSTHEITNDSEPPQPLTESELERVLDCGLKAPFLTSNWSRVIGLRFRSYGDQREEVRPKISTLSELRSSTCFERESICFPDDPQQ